MPASPSRRSAAPGHQVEPARAVQEHEADVPPGVAEAVELRLADARVVVDRDLAHGQPAAVRLEDHLRGELHPGRVEVERRQRVAADRSHAAVRVGDLHAEEDVEHARQDRVADEAVEERHRVAVDRPLEARADDEVVSLLELVDERRELLQRVGLVGVAHDDVLAARFCEAREVGAPVAAPRLGDDARAVRGGDLRRAVGRAVVDDDHLTGSSRASDPFERLVDDPPDGLLLVQAGDDDGDLRCRGRHRRTTVPGQMVAAPSVTVSQRAAACPRLEGGRRSAPRCGRRRGRAARAARRHVPAERARRGQAGGLGAPGLELQRARRRRPSPLRGAERRRARLRRPRPRRLLLVEGPRRPGPVRGAVRARRAPAERLLRLRRLGGLDGHPDVGVPGIEANSGSLGMGISKGRGIALGEAASPAAAGASS